MTYEEIMELINQKLDPLGSGKNGSYISQIRNSNSAQDWLNRNKDSVLASRDGQATYDSLNSGLSGMKAQAAAGIAMSGLQGLTQIGSAVSGLAKTQDTTLQQGQIDALGNVGNANYGSYDQLNSAIDSANYDIDLDYNTIRGVNTGQKLAGIGSSVASGFSAGSSIGGPWGAVVGGAVGLLSGIGGAIAGDIKAKKEQEKLRNQATIAANNAASNTAAAAVRISDRATRKGIANVAKYGGLIDVPKRDRYSKEEVLRNMRIQSLMVGYTPIKHTSREALFSKHKSIEYSHVHGGTKVAIKR